MNKGKVYFFHIKHITEIRLYNKCLFETKLGLMLLFTSILRNKIGKEPCRVLSTDISE